MKRHLFPRCPSFERSGIQCHCSPTSLLAVISSYCLATLPARMSAFKSHMRQNAQYRNLKWTFEYLLPCYYYTIKTNIKTIRSQVWHAPAGSSITSPKICGTKNLVVAKMFDFRRITLFCLWYRLSKHKWLYVLNICGGTWPTTVGPSGYAYACRQRSGHEWTASSALHDTRTVNLALAQCECRTGN